VIAEGVDAFSRPGGAHGAAPADAAE